MPESNPERLSLAVLIDAENASPKIAGGLFDEIAKIGDANVRRIYGDFSKPNLGGWAEVLARHAINVRQSFAYTTGKISTDMELVIDAMDLLHGGRVGGFCLVSSDSDFTPLIQRLRADGKEVFGFGEQKTPVPFIAACTRFIYLEEPKAAKAKLATKQKPGLVNPDTDLQTGHNLKNNAKLIKTLRNAVSASADEEGWANLSNITNRINNESPIDHRTYGFKKLVDLLEAIDLFEMRRTNSAILVRIAKVGGKKVVPKKVVHTIDDDDDGMDIPF